MKQFTLLLVLLWFSFVVMSNENYEQSLTKKPIVSEIELQGLSRTKSKVVFRELLFAENEILTTKDLLNSVQRLKNLRIFSHVIPLLQLENNNRVKVIIQLSEKWTSIPYANFSSGGGTEYFYAGMYDINTLGRFFETGIQYDNWNRKSGGVAWFHDPRFLDKRLTLQVQLWATRKPRFLYTTSGDSQGNYVLKRNRISLLFKKEINEWFQPGIGFDYDSDQIIDTTQESAIDPNTEKLLTNTDKQRGIFNTLFLQLGKLNYDNYLIDGKLSTLIVKHGGDYSGSDINLKMFKWKNEMYWLLPHKGNAAVNLTFGAAETDNLQHYFYIGGFDNIRGYLDGQLRNRAYWQLNTEYRIPSYKSSWLVLQHVFFIDLVQTAHQFSELLGDTQTYYSAGTGIRIISPKIYRFNGRFDIALITSGDAQSYISFGTQQFF